MTKHSIGPYFVKVPYSSNGHAHNMQFPVAMAVNETTTPPTYQFHTKGDSLVELEAGLSGLMELIAAMYASSASFQAGELWYKNTPTSNPVFKASISHGVTVGTSTHPTVVLSQMDLSFRSTAAGRYHVQLMEATQVVDQALNYGQLSTSADILALINWFTGSSAFVVARDDHYLATFIRFTTKTNDALRRHYLLR